MLNLKMFKDMKKMLLFSAALAVSLVCPDKDIK